VKVVEVLDRVDIRIVEERKCFKTFDKLVKEVRHFVKDYDLYIYHLTISSRIKYLNTFLAKVLY